MTETGSAKPGIERLVAAYVDAFQIPENLNHYAADDFEKAQRQFVRFCLQRGDLFRGRKRHHEKRGEENQ